MPLAELTLGGTSVSDLTPLKGMHLTLLSLRGCKTIEDVTPLRGMQLSSLDAGETSVSDIAPLRGMPLTYLNIDETNVSDLAPLEGMKLRYLHLRRTKVTDLSPLKGLPLLELTFTPAGITKGVEVVRRMRGIDRINFISAYDFWQRYDREEYGLPPAAGRR